jgi:hypothetical protein
MARTLAMPKNKAPIKSMVFLSITACAHLVEIIVKIEAGLLHG